MLLDQRRGKEGSSPQADSNLCSLRAYYELSPGPACLFCTAGGAQGCLGSNSVLGQPESKWPLGLHPLGLPQSPSE